MNVKSADKSTPGWYQRLFAWLMAHATAKYEAEMSDRKQELFADLHGNILEIGPGTGPNLRYYPGDVRWLGIEPNTHMYPYLLQEAERVRLNIDIKNGTAERLDVEDNSIDAVVSTLVLCSVENLSTVLQEILRVLKPGGRFFFLEHVAAPQKTRLRRIQNWIQPVWTVLGDGCHPNRETWIALENAGFKRVDYQHFRADVPAIVSPQIIGVAVKKAQF
ncbi:class I SAM-dependent methyltransferase [Myxosarcina sp. GI1]|uniref:class I SAM-dependent methyltransferase n=1 Tax=Myxosarcina sp. GI1 TaxID=1541065 RepID=UPI00055EDB24|nr:class I SAM-dependent methyltransferase [Myxosarcina sp. GI1]